MNTVGRQRAIRDIDVGGFSRKSLEVIVRK